MKLFGRSKVSEFLGDFVVYRNLVPYDKRLPALDQIHQQVGIPLGRIPRKNEPDYASAITHLLQLARKLDKPSTKIERLVFIGDTRLNDSTAFDNLCQAGQWHGLAFIASEKDAPLEIEVQTSVSGSELYLANRWEALVDFELFCKQRGFQIDESTAVVVDLDKTAIGARGRNAHVIDQARVLAVEKTVAGFLGDAFDETNFREAYHLLNQQIYHQFTLDNQDYLAYICLILGGELFDLDDVVREVESGYLGSFIEFISSVNDQRDQLSPELKTIHKEIYLAVQAGDPTPFKKFRRNEYLETVGLMGKLDNQQSIDVYLRDEILITNEVRKQTLEWKKGGALLFGLSDKPDEASIPTPELAARGYQPIHQTYTHIVGTE